MKKTFIFIIIIISINNAKTAENSHTLNICFNANLL